MERAIKHVRSDLAAHVGGASLGGGNRNSVLVNEEEGASEKANQATDADDLVPATDDHDGATPEERPEHREGDDVGVQHDRDATAVPQERQQQHGEGLGEAKKVATGSDESTTAGQGHEEEGEEEEEAPSTPVNEHPTSLPARNLPRSQSAEPVKAHRLSRTYASSVPSQDGMSSTAETGDESSFSVTGSRRRNKKKAKKAPMSKKVKIDDFEMMRVLGKGCAGKVLLVKHKNTTGLFALKAITKRHVLAHQELQHTLTEQAVLKRMAAESKDPFVVKLWWSFHDKENLFLVMVCFLCAFPWPCHTYHVDL